MDIIKNDKHDMRDSFEQEVMDRAKAYINEYHNYKEETNSDQLTGFAVIDPINDLNKEVYELAKSKGIPEESIVWLDPSHFDTVGLNLMVDPIEKVAEEVTKILIAFQKSQNNPNFSQKNDSFLSEAQKSVLKNYIYLLKMTSPKDHQTLKDLTRTLKSPNETHLRMNILADQVNAMKDKLTLLKQLQLDEQVTKVEVRELEDKLEIASAYFKWFKYNIVPRKFHDAKIVRTDSKVETMEDTDPNKYEYKNLQEDYLAGLIDVLQNTQFITDLSLALFNSLRQLNLERAIKKGKILLFNTEKYRLGDRTSKALAKVFVDELKAAALMQTTAANGFAIYLDE